MTAMRLEPEFVNWRMACLRQAGFGDDLARCIARDDRYDMHALLELIDRGCPPHLAVRILAPLDQDPAPC